MKDKNADVIVQALKQWEKEFRRDAKADRYALFRRHMREFELPAKPKMLLEGTILAVQACLMYACVDNKPWEAFLEMQRYDPSDDDNAVYAFTFDLCNRAYARLLVSPMFEVIDLADLLNHPWWALKVSGYHHFWVSRVDGKPLSIEEQREIEERVTQDLEFDYTEEELQFWIDCSENDDYLCVYVQELDSDDED